MKKIMLGISMFFVVLIALVFYSAHAFAIEKPNHGRDNNEDRHNNKIFNSEKELSRSACGVKSGNPVINITEKVKNDVDSGFGPNAYFPSDPTNYWNVEGYMRHIHVWSTGTNTWCATVVYDNGQFNAFYNQTGPAGTGLIGSGVDGEMHGGYRATFTGTLLPVTLWPKNGNVGTVDYKCDLHATCSGRVDWVAQYFNYDSASFAQPWWGWIYNANDHHGTWINASDVLPANSGNIL